MARLYFEEIDDDETENAETADIEEAENIQYMNRKVTENIEYIEIEDLDDIDDVKETEEFGEEYAVSRTLKSISGNVERVSYTVLLFVLHLTG